MAPSIRRDLYSEVTSRILAELERGTALRRARRKQRRIISVGWRWQSRSRKRHKPLKRGCIRVGPHAASHRTMVNGTFAAKLLRSPNSVHLAKLRASLHHAFHIGNRSAEN